MHITRSPDRKERPPRTYDPAIRQPLMLLWEASDRACGKRLRSLLAVLLPALEHHEYLRLEPAIRTELLSLSAATIDRLLREVRTRKYAGRGTRSPALLRRVSRPGADGPWTDPQPGFLQLQMTHADRRRARNPVRTLTVRDQFSGWTQCATVPDWQPESVVRCLDTLLDSLPFTPRALALDEKWTAVRDWLMRPGAAHPLEVLCVARRRGRSRTDPAGQDGLLARIAAVTSVYANVFRSAPNHAALTPCARLLAADALSDAQQSRLRDHARSLDPLKLLAEIRELNAERLVWLAAQPRPIKRGPPAALRNRRRPRLSRRSAHPRSWRTHANVFEHAWPAIQNWWLGDPEQTVKNLLERLKRQYPGVYHDGHLRSLQRRMQRWRRPQAGREDEAAAEKSG